MPVSTLSRWDDVISLSVISLYAIPCFLALITQNLRELLPLVGMLFTVGLNETLKYAVIGERSPRPAGARDCNVWVSDGPQAGRPGMPSGHSAHVSFVAGYYLQRIANISALSPITRFLLAVALLLYALLVMLSRYTKCCHTVPQLLVGSSLGLLMSVVFHSFVLRP